MSQNREHCLECMESLINTTKTLHLRSGKRGWQEMWRGKPMQPRHTGKGARCVEVWKSSSRARNPFLKQHATQETVVILWCWCMESWVACCNVDFSILFGIVKSSVALHFESIQMFLQSMGALWTDLELIFISQKKTIFARDDDMDSIISLSVQLSHTYNKDIGATYHFRQHKSQSGKVRPLPLISFKVSALHHRNCPLKGWTKRSLLWKQLTTLQHGPHHTAQTSLFDGSRRPRGVSWHI